MPSCRKRPLHVAREVRLGNRWGQPRDRQTSLGPKQSHIFSSSPHHLIGRDELAVSLQVCQNSINKESPSLVLGKSSDSNMTPGGVCLNPRLRAKCNCTPLTALAQNTGQTARFDQTLV